MWKTVLALLVTIVVIPFLAFRFDDPLTILQADTLGTLVRIYLVAALLCFVVSALSGNYSQVDKLWSTIPIAYAWVVAFASGFDPRIVLMSVLVSAWGIRLSLNFARRGGYSWRIWSGQEDYRWAVLRARPEFAANWKWILFNFFFISLYQMGLILLITLPALRSMEGRPLSLVDWVLAGLMLILVILETIADQQQWNFHKVKQQLQKEGEEMPDPQAKGFVHSGLWGLVRHPNYAAEQAIWIVFYFFSVTATGQWLNWSVMGAILLVLLFWGSSNFSESISLSKYPAYADYQRRVPRFVPFTRPSRNTSPLTEVKAEA
jgi:steroid 5-alpha reductase family enzyme